MTRSFLASLLLASVLAACTAGQARDLSENVGEIVAAIKPEIRDEVEEAVSDYHSRLPEDDNVPIDPWNAGLTAVLVGGLHVWRNLTRKKELAKKADADSK